MFALEKGGCAVGSIFVRNGERNLGQRFEATGTEMDPTRSSSESHISGPLSSRPTPSQALVRPCPARPAPLAPWFDFILVVPLAGSATSNWLSAPGRGEGSRYELAANRSGPVRIPELRGTFRIERTDGSHFDVRIPPFSLESNKDDKAPPAGYSWLLPDPWRDRSAGTGGCGGLLKDTAGPSVALLCHGGWDPIGIMQPGPPRLWVSDHLLSKTKQKGIGQKVRKEPAVPSSHTKRSMEDFLKTKGAGPEPGASPQQGGWKRTPTKQRGDIFASFMLRSGDRFGRGPAPPPYQRRIGMIQEMMVMAKEGKQDEVTELLKTLRQVIDVSSLTASQEGTGEAVLWIWATMPGRADGLRDDTQPLDEIYCLSLERSNGSRALRARTPIRGSQCLNGAVAGKSFVRPWLPLPSSVCAARAFRFLAIGAAANERPEDQRCVSLPFSGSADLSPRPRCHSASRALEMKRQWAWAEDLGMESTSLDDVLYRFASFRSLVDPITHDLIISLARYVHCPKTSHAPVWRGLAYRSRQARARGSLGLRLQAGPNERVVDPQYGSALTMPLCLSRSCSFARDRLSSG
ncbi:hypothetical protein AAFF_G00376430 [Aldrovandia affinis]|uniref:Uncharacterized protein n=1 Tax=Aldrovandia affinis TaxID=143900 RepID=A0AAD7SFK8_9TELE|nr:hypothetical protein AAFF_G00376430 [Aldrovandia affinis]